LNGAVADIFFGRAISTESRTRIVVATNLAFGQWPSLSGDVKAPTAQSDRLTDRRDIIEPGNDGWTLKNRA
jgi:IstB-like ATP binding protein